MGSRLCFEITRPVSVDEACFEAGRSAGTACPCVIDVRGMTDCATDDWVKNICMPSQPDSSQPGHDTVDSRAG